MRNLYTFHSAGQHMLLTLVDESGTPRKGALLATNYRTARAFARNATVEFGCRASVYRVGSQTGNDAAEADRLAIQRANGENCAWFLLRYDRQHEGSVLHGVQLCLREFREGGAA